MDLDAVFDFARKFWIVWLMILFFVVIYWAYRPTNKKRFEKDAEIPLKDDE